MLPSPDALRHFAAELTASGRELAVVRHAVLRCAAGSGWSGPAHDEFHATVAALAGRLDVVAGGCADRAAEVRRLADRAAAELSELHHLEHVVLGVLHRLAGEVVSGVRPPGDGLATLYHRMRTALPPRGSPSWRDLAAELGRAGLL